MRKTNLFGVPENYLNVVDTDYYLPTHLETSAVNKTLSDGKPDAVSALYNDVGITPWPEWCKNKDYYNVTTPWGVSQDD